MWGCSPQHQARLAEALRFQAGAYARQTIALTVTGDTASNSANIEFPEATGSWGTVTHMAVFDALSGGNQIAYAALTASKAIGIGDVLRFPIGDIDVTLD
jgi:hypothetical protein